MDLESLRTEVSRGASFRYLLFYGHKPKDANRIDESCLSQWYPARFEVSGTGYPTAEHWMMAEKARLFGDAEILGKIIEASGPAEAKKLGRKVRNYDDRAWADQRFKSVVEGNVAKFAQNPDLKSFLLSTGSSVLVEASPHDRIWGIGMRKSDDGARNPLVWKGKNLLGFALMEVRDGLLTES